MKWAVNVRTQTLVISLRSWEVKELFLAIKRVKWSMAREAPPVLSVRFALIVLEALRVISPALFPSVDKLDRDQEFELKQVDHSELCDEGS